MSEGDGAANCLTYGTSGLSIESQNSLAAKSKILRGRGLVITCRFVGNYDLDKQVEGRNKMVGGPCGAPLTLLLKQTVTGPYVGCL